MQEKVVFDTNIYIGIFNRGQFTGEISWFNSITYLVHPVLHELWMGAKGKSEINHLIRFGNTFVKLGRLVQPEPAPRVDIGLLFGFNSPSLYLRLDVGRPASHTV